MADVVVASVARTPIGTAYKGSLVGVDAYRLAEIAMVAALERSGVDTAAVDDCAMGESMQGGGDIGRHAAIVAGLMNLPAAATQRWCASGMAAVHYMAANIEAGMIDCALAGGSESMSTAPATSKPGPDGQPAMWLPAANPETPETPPFNMALTVGENTARLAGVSREDADAWALESHRRAIAAIDAGWFTDEIVPVALPDGRVMDTDEHPRRTSSAEKLASLPVLNPQLDNPTVTAGNSSGLNDGAAALVLCSREFADAHGLPKLAALRSWASVAADPVETGLAPSRALPKALGLANLSTSDLAAVEVNEAFASVAVAFTRALELDPAIVNVAGSGCSLGHPIACTGARMIVTMVNELHRRDAQFGAVAMCAAGGMGAATVIERL